MRQRRWTQMSAGVWCLWWNSSVVRYPGGLFEWLMEIDLLQADSSERGEQVRHRLAMGTGDSRLYHWSIMDQTLEGGIEKKKAIDKAKMSKRLFEMEPSRKERAETSKGGKRKTGETTEDYYRDGNCQCLRFIVTIKQWCMLCINWQIENSARKTYL